jgi:hypothetical protein
MVARLLSGGPVVTPAVSLNHQSQTGPVEIDPIAVHGNLCFGRRQVCGADDRQKLALKASVGQGIEAEYPAHTGHTGPRAKASHGAPESFRINQIKAISLVDRSLHTPFRSTGGEINERGDRVRHRYPLYLPAVLRPKVDPPVHLNFRTPGGPPQWHDDVDCPRMKERCETPEGRRTTVAEQRTLAAAQYSSHPASPLIHFWSTDRVDAAPQGVQTTSYNAMLDRTRADAKCEQLAPGHHSMLPANQIPDLRRRILMLFPHSHRDKHQSG